MALISRLKLATFLALAVLPSVFAQETAVVPGAPRLLPEDTLAYIRIENVDELKADAANSATGRMLADPKLRPIAGQYYAAASELFEMLGNQVGLTLDQLVAIPKGQLAASLILLDPVNPAAPAAVGPKDESPEGIRKRLEAKKLEQQQNFGGLLVIETGRDNATLRNLLDTVEKKLSESGWVTRTEKIKQTTLVQIIRVADESRAVEYFTRDGVTVIGIGAGAGRAALKRWDGESLSPSLAESTDFAAVMSPCIGAEDTRPQITFFANPFRIAERIIKGRGNGAALVWPIVENLGVGKIRGIGGSIFQGGEFFDDIAHMHVLLDPPRDGIFGVVRPTEGDTNPPEWIPADVASYTSINWRIDKSFDGFERIFDTFAGEGGFATRATDPYLKATTLDLRESLVNATADRIISVTWLQQPVTFGSQSRLIGIELKDPAQMTQTIDQLRQTIWKRLESETVGATTVYRGRPRDRQPPAGFRVPTPCGAIVGKWMLISDNRELLEHAMRAQSGAMPRLSDLPDYDLVVSELGGQLGDDKPFMLSFSRDSETLRQVYDLGSSPQVREFAKQRGENNPVGKRISELMEANDLPPFDEFKKYFAPSGTFGYDEPTGMHFGRYTLKPE